MFEGHFRYLPQSLHQIIFKFSCSAGFVLGDKFQLFVKLDKKNMGKLKLQIF